MLTLQSSTISADACSVRALFVCFLKHLISVRITLNTGITYLYVICLCEHPILHLSACASQRQTADVKPVTKMSVCFVQLTLSQAVFDDFFAARGNAIRENDLKFHQQVSTLGGVLRSGKPLPYKPSHWAGLDDITAWEGLRLSVKRRDVNRTPT